MKLRNKKTGQLGNFIINKDHFECVDLDYVPEYRNLTELGAEWEDYEEPKEHWHIMEDGSTYQHEYISEDGVDIDSMKAIGNDFSTEEEAKKAVEKLKAWKRLKDKGFRFKDYTRKFDGFKRVDGSVFIVAELNDEGVIGMIDELNICFGGEE